MTRGSAHTVLSSDFSGAMAGVSAIRQRLGPDREQRLAPDDRQALAGMLASPAHFGRNRAHTLYLAAAELLSRSAGAGDSEALDGLLHALAVGDRRQRMASAEGLGLLPVEIRGPGVRVADPVEAEAMDWAGLLRVAGLPHPGSVRTEGRSLLAEMSEGRMLVVKCARAGENPRALALEAAWMDRLAAMELSTGFPARFGVPRPVGAGKSGLVRLASLPDSLPHALRHGLHAEGWALPYVAPPGYFSYPNDHRPEHRPDDKAFAEAMARNGLLLGRLSGQGVLHTAVIPLFHNRTQTARRTDAGVYKWWRGGRLDRWLESSRFPNVGLSGPRDFEHLTSCRTSGRTLFRTMAAQILSLLMVAGSRFRTDEPDHSAMSQVGDHRDGFDPGLIKQVVRDTVLGFQQGFSGHAPNTHQKRLSEPGLLVERMVEEMGVDRHMDEHFRVEDQKGLTNEEFLHFLKERGVDPVEAAGLRQGAADIALRTGPHLGDFNRGCSLPELLEYSAVCAGLAVWRRFTAERKT